MANVPSPALLSTIEQHEHRVLSVGKSGAPLKLSFAACRELDLAERVLTSAWLYAGCLDEANLRQCSLIRAYLVEASFVQALLDGALLGKADLRKASFRGASMKECNIVRASLSEADLQGADLTKAFLGRANLANAILRNADLHKSLIYLDKHRILCGRDHMHHGISSAFFSIIIKVSEKAKSHLKPQALRVCAGKTLSSIFQGFVAWSIQWLLVLLL